MKLNQVRRIKHKKANPRATPRKKKIRKREIKKTRRRLRTRRLLLFKLKILLTLLPQSHRLSSKHQAKSQVNHSSSLNKFLNSLLVAQIIQMLASHLAQLLFCKLEKTEATYCFSGKNYKKNGDYSIL